MLGIVKEIDGQKIVIPLTTDTGAGAPVGTLIQQYKKKPMSGYLYCDGSTFDQNAYPALYMYLGSNVLPDYSNNTENGYVYIKATSGLAENQQDNVLRDVKDYVDNSIDDKVGRYKLTATKTSNGWQSTKDLSNFPVGIYKVTAMHSSSGAVTDALILKTGYDYLVQDTYKTGSISISVSNNVVTVSETTSSIGVVVVSLNLVGTK